jgi:hypothetical protein
MRRFLAWLGCAVGVAWILRRLRRSVPEPAAPDPAEELRRKLEASRADEPVPPPAEPEPPEAGLDERRRAVHDRGRAAIDAMRVRPDDPGDS